jgi:flagellar assembly protein FliH
LSTRRAGVLRDIAVDARMHVLAGRGGPSPQEAPARDEAVEAAYRRGLAEGRALAAVHLREEAERMVQERVREQLAAALGEQREAARAEGYESGRAQAERELQDERRASARRVETVLGDIASRTREWMHASEDELVLLAHDVACRIVAEAAVRPEAVRLLVRRLLDERSDDAAEQLHVHVHPDDFSAFAKGESPGNWRWVSDASVTLGGVCLRSPRGGFDARLETQWAALGDALRQARARRDGGAA